MPQMSDVAADFNTLVFKTEVESLRQKVCANSKKITHQQ